MKKVECPFCGGKIALVERVDRYTHLKEIDRPEGAYSLGDEIKVRWDGKKTMRYECMGCRYIWKNQHEIAQDVGITTKLGCPACKKNEVTITTMYDRGGSVVPFADQRNKRFYFCMSCGNVELVINDREEKWKVKTMPLGKKVRCSTCGKTIEQKFCEECGQ